MSEAWWIGLGVLIYVIGMPVAAYVAGRCVPEHASDHMYIHPVAVAVAWPLIVLFSWAWLVVRLIEVAYERGKTARVKTCGLTLSELILSLRDAQTGNEVEDIKRQIRAHPDYFPGSTEVRMGMALIDRKGKLKDGNSDDL